MGGEHTLGIVYHPYKNSGRFSFRKTPVPWRRYNMSTVNYGHFPTSKKKQKKTTKILHYVCNLTRDDKN